MKGHVFLIGFMGAGKSTVGRLVARDMRRAFVDLDTRIVEREGRPIADIFDTDGESEFRALERAELEALAVEPDGVVACGGGITGDPRNRAFLSAHGFVCYLETDAEDVLDRVSADGTRPLMSGSLDEVVALLESRRGSYEQVADVTVATSGRTVREVADEVVRAVRSA